MKVLKIIGIFSLLTGCVTDDPAPTVQAPQAVIEQQPEPTPIATTTYQQPTPPPKKGLNCQPQQNEATAKNNTMLGFSIKNIRVVESNPSDALLVIKRESSIGNIPLKDIKFDSTSYRSKNDRIYGEWEDSEHWLRLNKTTGRYEGSFIYESEYNFTVDCD